MFDLDFICQLLLNVVQRNPASQGNADSFHVTSACLGNILFSQVVLYFGFLWYINMLQKKKKRNGLGRKIWWSRCFILSVITIYNMWTSKNPLAFSTVWNWKQGHNGSMQISQMRRNSAKWCKMLSHLLFVRHHRSKELSHSTFKVDHKFRAVSPGIKE